MICDARGAMLWCALVALAVAGGASARQCKAPEGYEQQYNECSYCSYDSEGAPEPELLWATSGSAVLRARLCGCWCRNKTLWFYRNVTKDDPVSRLEEDEKQLPDCTNKEYCEIFGSPNFNVVMYVAFHNYNKSSKIIGNGTYVRFCPDAAPPAPSNVSCRKRRGEYQLRWTYDLERVKCRSYPQFVVSTDRKLVPRKWRWLGEAYSLRASGRPFGGLVHRCGDDPRFLCANLSAVYHHDQVQLGVRRSDADENTSVNSTDWVECREDVGPVAPPLVPWSEPEPASAEGRKQTTNAPASGGHPRHHHACGCTTATLLVALVALTVCVLLLPVAFYAGRRSRERKQLDVSWQRMREERVDWNSLHCSASTVCGDRPPEYEYDYAQASQGPAPVQSAPPPPLPPPRPAPAPAPAPAACADEPNYLYERTDPRL